MVTLIYIDIKYSFSLLLLFWRRGGQWSALYAWTCHFATTPLSKQISHTLCYFQHHRQKAFLNFEQLQLMLSYEHWQSTTTANSKQISHSQCCCQHSFQIVVNFKRFAFAVFTFDLIWPLCHRSSFKTHLSHSLDISMCYRHWKYKNHRRNLMFSLWRSVR